VVQSLPPGPVAVRSITCRANPFWSLLLLFGFSSELLRRLGVAQRTCTIQLTPPTGVEPPITSTPFTVNGSSAVSGPQSLDPTASPGSSFQANDGDNITLIGTAINASGTSPSATFYFVVAQGVIPPTPSTVPPAPVVASKRWEMLSILALSSSQPAGVTLRVFGFSAPNCLVAISPQFTFSAFAVQDYSGAYSGIPNSAVWMPIEGIALIGLKVDIISGATGGNWLLQAMLYRGKRAPH
jgi:hypothetical protein